MPKKEAGTRPTGASKSVSQEPSPDPQPWSRGVKSKGLLRNRASLREAFDTDQPKGTKARDVAEEPHQDSRDSHDLLWSPKHVTHDSMVNNMLLSFDQLSVPNPPANQASGPTRSRAPSLFRDEDPRLPMFRNRRNRGHTHSSSHDSDSDLRIDDASGRYLRQFAHSRRSNSSSNVPPILRRIDSERSENESQPNTRELRSEVPRVPGSLEGVGSKGPNGRRKGSKGSKGSGSSSVDFGRMVGAPRRQHWAGRRSSSLDTFDHESILAASTNPIGHPVSTLGDPPSVDYGSLEAAPTPTVPVGPRRNRSPSRIISYPPQPARPPPPVSPMRNKENNRSSIYQKNKKGRKYPQDVSCSKDNSDIYLSRVPSQDLPPSSNPFMIRSTSAGLTQITAAPGNTRPGFFRKLFGSSRNVTPIEKDLNQPQSLSNDIAATPSDSRPESGNVAQIPTPKLHNAQPEVGPGSKPKDNSLNKKSSFFRRRKKNSISDLAPPPTFPWTLQPPPPANSVRRPSEHGSVSSLRQVMNPYLNSPVAVQHRQKPQSAEIEDPEVESRGYFANFATNRQSSLSSIKGIEKGARVGSSRDDPSKPLAPESPNVKESDNLNKLVPRHRMREDASLPERSDSETKAPVRQESDDLSTMMSSKVRSKADPSTSSLPDNGGQTGEIPSHGSAILLAENHPQSALSPAAESSQPKSPRDKNTTQSESAANRSSGNEDSNYWVSSTGGSSTKIRVSPQRSSSKTGRVWLEPSSSEEDVNRSSKLSLPLEGAVDSAKTSKSTVSDYQTASSQIVSPVLGDPPNPLNQQPEVQISHTDAIVDEIEPTKNDERQAQSIFNGQEDFIAKAKAAAWLGDPGLERARVRTAYMNLFEWTNLSIVVALRGLCTKLVLKAETQQVDRILDALSTRWCACNPDHGFKATDVVHTICYSILLLNTDLHMADIEQKMTRAQFIKNTMPTIRRVAADAAPDGFETVRASILPRTRSPLPWSDSPPTTAISPTFAPESQERTSMDDQRPTRRLSNRPSDRSHRDSSYAPPVDDCGPLVKAPFYGKMSTWEIQVETVLKNSYNSIRQQRLPLHGNDEFDRRPEPTPSTSSLSVLTGNMLRRTPSMLSKAGSESQMTRGRPSDYRFNSSRWTSKTRSRPRLYPASTVDSSRTSLDDQSSIWSPSVSSTWSRYSLGKTQTSMSVDSFGSSVPQGDYQQSIGFANALSQAIIREEAAVKDPAEESIRVAPLLEDESLELAGAPWAKEGLLKHKHHLESVDKKAKNKKWADCFAVIEKGWMRLFSFNINAKSLRQKTKSQKLPGGVVGGGNWTENAEALGKFLLRQTIASALPSPGYSKARPHVWALSLPTGAVHLFHVGTPEIVKEFVATANYWSARLSKEPLVGGISNIEYGWSDSVIGSISAVTENPLPSTNPGPRPSLQSSIRSSIDTGSIRPKLPGDRIIINDWTPPQQSMVASALMEVDQLNALTTYVKNVEDELQRHNETRSAMLLAFSPRHPNSSKAMANWERKSSYLLREIVKFRTYIDCLHATQAQKAKIYAARLEPAKEEGEEITVEEAARV